MSEGSIAISRRRELLRPAIKVWPLILPLLLLLPGLGAFPYPSAEAAYSDLSLSHYPYAIFLRRSLFVAHRLPLWSPLIFSGSPFAANPLSGMWYPPGWPALILPLPFGFNLLVLAHLFWGGLGVYKLLRSEKLAHAPALFGALAFTALPKLFAHYGAGHLTLLYAIPWTPWLLYAGRRAAESCNALRPRHSFRRYVFSFEAPILALIFLADPRWGFFASLLWAAYRFFVAGDEGGPLERLAGLFAQACLALLLAAPLLLPLIEFARLSSRSSMSASDVLTFSLPWARLLGLAIPDFNGFQEYMLYAGQAALLLALAVVLSPRRRKTVNFWLITWILAMLYALGENLPPFRWLAGLPLVDLLRVPSRSLFVAGLALAALAAYGLQRILDDLAQLKSRRFGLLLAGYTGFLVVLAAGIFALGQGLPANFAWAALFALLGALWLGLRLGGRLTGQVWLVGLFALAMLDWGAIDFTLFSPHPADDVLAEDRLMTESLANLQGQEGLFRIYSPSYSLAQQTSAGMGLQLAEGVDPLHLQAYTDYMSRATGIPDLGYSVTLPPFPNGDPNLDNAAYVPDPALLGLLNVRFVVSEFDLDVKGLVFEGRSGNTRLYRNLESLPRAWVQPDSAAPGEQTRPVESLDWSPDRISFQAAGPGMAVLSEMDYPGWQVYVDGRQSSVVAFQGLLRSVPLQDGDHSVVFVFQPLSVYVGIAIGALCWLLLALGWTISRRTKS